MSSVDPILNPTVFIGSFEWREPVTTLTDALVSLVAIYAVIMYSRYKGEKSNNYNFFKAYFICFSFGMMSAAWFGHGLVAYVGVKWKVIGWVFSATGHLFFSLASLMQIRPIIRPSAHNIIKTILFTQYAVFVFLMIHPSFSQFIYTQMSSVFSLIGLILPMQFFNYMKTKEKGSLIITIAILCGLIPGILYNTQFSISRWYNYHDISHTIVAGIMFLMFLGTSRLTMLEKFNRR